MKIKLLNIMKKIKIFTKIILGKPHPALQLNTHKQFQQKIFQISSL